MEPVNLVLGANTESFAELVSIALAQSVLLAEYSKCLSPGDDDLQQIIELGKRLDAVASDGPAAAPPLSQQAADQRISAAWTKHSAVNDYASGYTLREHVLRAGREILKLTAQHPPEPEGWREFIENIAQRGSEPLNSLTAGSTKDDRRHWLGVIRNKARDLLQAEKLPK